MEAPAPQGEGVVLIVAAVAMAAVVISVSTDAAASPMASSLAMDSFEAEICRQKRMRPTHSATSDQTAGRPNRITSVLCGNTA
jgi:hypothetical protein